MYNCIYQNLSNYGTHLSMYNCIYIYQNHSNYGIHLSLYNCIYQILSNCGIPLSMYNCNIYQVSIELGNARTASRFVTLSPDRQDRWTFFF